MIWSDLVEKNFGQREKFEQKPVVTTEEMKTFVIAAKKSGKKIRPKIRQKNQAEEAKQIR